MLCEAASRGFEAAMVEDAEVRLQEYREAVARALHDVIGGDVALTMRLLELHRAHPEGDRVSVAISTLGGVLSDIRGLITDVRVRPRRASIGEGLRAVVATAPGGVSLDVQVTGDESAVPAHLHQEVFLVLREGLRNAFRHAGASVVRVRMRVQPTVVLATLEDDGRGLRGADADTDGYGIVSMRQRVRALGGRLLISDGESGGTTLQIEVPLPKASEPAAARPGGAA
jgi:signal transduction histidine kinase